MKPFLSINAEQILNTGKDVLILPADHSLDQLQELNVNSCLPPEHAHPHSLVFVSTQAQLELALMAKAPMIIAHKSLKAPSPQDLGKSIFLQAHQINMAMAKILPLFDLKPQRFDWESRIHPTAIIHPTAKVSESAKINPYAVIGAHAKIGDHVTIGSHSVVEFQAEIGKHTTLHPHVVIGAFCTIGSHCEIHPHTTIGSDGYGYASDSQFKHTKIPQVGNVVIEDHVEIGSSVAIDRAALTQTVIHSGTKIDNLCHIAHNCTIGSDSFVTAGFFTAGSTHIGKRFVTGGNTAVADHITIADGVVLAGRTTVTGDITEGGQYGGHPVQPVREYLKTIASLGQINQIRKQVQKIIKHLGLEE